MFEEDTQPYIQAHIPGVNTGRAWKWFLPLEGTQGLQCQCLFRPEPMWLSLPALLEARLAGTLLSSLHKEVTLVTTSVLLSGCMANDARCLSWPPACTAIPTGWRPTGAHISSSMQCSHIMAAWQLVWGLIQQTSRPCSLVMAAEASAMWSRDSVPLQSDSLVLCSFLNQLLLCDSVFALIVGPILSEPSAPLPLRFLLPAHHDSSLPISQSQAGRTQCHFPSS